ncbi:MAG: ATP-binding cassette domain-containing protein [Limnochordales bacterium]|nr:ATP-binding cassette domain-containing protein [Limnochordales bacterium]
MNGGRSTVAESQAQSQAQPQAQAQAEATPPAEAAPPAIETFGLTRRFGSLVAVDNLTLSVRAGSIFGLLGPNGAGKSTTIKMLTTLLPPSEGSARVAGCDVVREAREVRRRIGYVPQLLSADGALTGYENLLIFAKLYGVPRAEREERIWQALELMGLKEAAHMLVRQYSGGMIRRLEIAQAVLHRPSVLFMDEPTVGLDPVARRAVWEHVRELRRRSGVTVLITTHYMEEADELCDEVAIVHLGRVAAVGTPTALKAAVGPEASLDDVFVHYTGSSIETGGSFRDALRTRRTVRRLG